MVNPNLNTKSPSEVGVKQEEEVPSDRIDIADDEDNNNRNDAAEIDEKVESDPQNTYLQVQSTLKILCNFFLILILLAMNKCQKRTQLMTLTCHITSFT